MTDTGGRLGAAARGLAAAAGVAALLAALLGVRAVAVLTGSMGAALPTGSLVLTTRVQPSDVRVGDVVALRPPPPYDHGRPVLHRVVALDVVGGTPVLRTQGDMNPGPDPWTVPLTSDLGRARASVPALGRLTAAGRPGAVVLGLGLVSAVVGVRRWRAVECACHCTCTDHPAATLAGVGAEVAPARS